MNYENHGLISVTFSRIIAMSSALKAPENTLPLKWEIFQANKILPPQKRKKKRNFFPELFSSFSTPPSPAIHNKMF